MENPEGSIYYQKIDIWSLGIILCELVLDKCLWNNLKLGQRIRKVLSLIQSNGSIFERIAREHNCFEQYLVSINLTNMLLIKEYFKIAYIILLPIH